jgi:hypothetical protein
MGWEQVKSLVETQISYWRASQDERAKALKQCLLRRSVAKAWTT